MHRRSFISLLLGAAGAPLVPWRGIAEPRCRCGHGIEEHPLGGNCCGGDADCWCKAYEPEDDDEPMDDATRYALGAM